MPNAVEMRKVKENIEMGDKKSNAKGVSPPLFHLFIAFVKAMFGAVKIVLAIFVVLFLAAAASLLLDIPGGCWRHAETVRRLESIKMIEVSFCAPATVKEFAEYMSQATKDFDDPAVLPEKRGIKFVCKESVAAKTGPEKPKQDAPLIPCPGIGATTTAWDVLTNFCHSVGCKFEVGNGKVEIGE